MNKSIDRPALSWVEEAINENRERAASYNEGLLVIGATQTRSSDAAVYRRTGKTVVDVACRTISTPLEQSNKVISRQMACFYDLHQLRTEVVDRAEKLYISPERWLRSSNEKCNCIGGSRCRYVERPVWQELFSRFGRVDFALTS